jgi:hypothetical protein
MRSFIIVSALLLASCMDPYTTARQTILVAKNVVTVADAGFQTFWDAKQAECLKQFPAQDPQYAACVKQVKDVMATWTISKRIADASWAEAEAIITAAEQKHQGLPVDWMTPATRGICVVAQALEFLPASVKQHIQGILALVKHYTCAPAAK